MVCFLLWLIIYLLMGVVMMNVMISELVRDF